MGTPYGKSGDGGGKTGGGESMGGRGGGGGSSRDGSSRGAAAKFSADTVARTLALSDKEPSDGLAGKTLRVSFRGATSRRGSILPFAVRHAGGRSLSNSTYHGGRLQYQPVALQAHAKCSQRICHCKFMAQFLYILI